MKLLVIADDLTGGLDTGVQFVAKGMPSRVIVNGQKWKEYMCGDNQVLILDAETRRMSGENAYETVKNIVLDACKSGIDYIYKKTDSAQRGNIGFELQAVLDGAGQDVIHYAPAFPQMGRITKLGIHYVDNVPVANSVFGSEPYEPVRCSYIPDIIHEQSKVLVERDGGLMEGTDTESDLDNEKRIRLYDASSEEELDRIATTIVAQKNKDCVTLLAGCAGFAAALSQALQCQVSKIHTGQDMKMQKKKHFLAVIGSINPITGQQLDYAIQNGFVRLQIKKEQMHRNYWKSEKGLNVLKEWKKVFMDNHKVILDANDVPEEKSIMEYAKENGRNKDYIRNSIVDILGMLVCELLHNMEQTTLLVVGGDTVKGLLRKLNVQELAPVCEVLSGVVCSEFIKDGKTVKLLSKSGGFGKETLLVDLADMLL